MASEKTGNIARHQGAGGSPSDRYADIIDLPRPAMHHQRMDPINRAKIFAPFDALRGLDEEVAAAQERASTDTTIEYSRLDPDP
ncbi:MAG: hypothetical protein PUF90_00415 [Lachnospiraceae bacterium]|nr:hypothetical protein [Lachnospiraceae bacterium]